MHVHAPIRVLGLSVLVLAAGAVAVPTFGQRGYQVNVDAFGHDILGDAANEPTIAVSPLNPNIIVVGWRQFDTVTSDRRRAGVAYTTDGGLTWTAGVLATPPGQPAGAGQTDPVLCVDSDGVFGYWSELFDPSPYTQYLYTSQTGGATWSTPVKVVNPPVHGDKPWFVIDRTTGIGRGNLYGGWSSFSGNSYTIFTRSTDGGQTFSTPVRIADQDGRQFMLHFAIGPDGELYAAWRHYPSNSIFVTKSTNAQNPAAQPTFDALGAGGVNGLDVRIDNGNDPGFPFLNPVGFHQLWLGVDRTGGPRRGWVYCVWSDARSDVCDIILARSTDGGHTWQSGIRVNDDPLGNGRYQWMVAMDVAPNGRIDVVWYDTRDDPQNRRSALYYSNSIDGGVTWSANQRISDAFDTTIGYPVQQKIGDYNQIVSADEVVHIIYAATFNGGEDIWYLPIAPFVAGDLNCDGRVDFGDINPFVLALTNPPAYAVRYPGCPILNGDINGDGFVDFGDINPFVRLLTGP